MNGRFCYPFLNALPFPWGFVGTATAALFVFFTFFQVGALLNHQLKAARK